MKLVFRLLLLAAVAGLGFWLWTIFFPSPEKVVLKKMSSLAAAATFRAADSNLIRAAKAARLAGLFATDAQIIINVPDLPNRTLTGREEIQETALGRFANVPVLNVRFLDVTGISALTGRPPTRIARSRSMPATARITTCKNCISSSKKWTATG